MRLNGWWDLFLNARQCRRVHLAVRRVRHAFRILAVGCSTFDVLFATVGHCITTHALRKAARQRRTAKRKRLMCVGICGHVLECASALALLDCLSEKGRESDFLIFAPGRL